MRIALLAGDFHPLTLEPGPITYTRMVVPGRELARRGHEVVVTPRFRVHERTGEIAAVDLVKGIQVEGIEAVVMHHAIRENHPDIVRHAVKAGQRVYIDVDDWYYGVSPRHRAFDSLREQESQRMLTKVLREATGALVSTPFLAEQLEKFTPTHLCRNSVDPKAWGDPPAQHDRVRLGWVGSMQTHAGDLDILKGIVGPWLEKVNGQFVHVGAHQEDERLAEDVLDIDPKRVQAFGPLKRRALGAAYELFDIGLVPLADTPFNHAKSYLKGLEYAAAGKPFIASATPEYRHLKGRHDIGRVARRPRDWVKHLDALADIAVRREEGRHNYERVFADCTVASAADAWEDALLSK